MEILRWHVAQIPDGPMSKSLLLFPSDIGGFRSGSCLTKPFGQVAKAIGLKKRVTARAMRRTFQDLARAAAPDVVTRSISRHATAEMQRHYSTVAVEEQRRAIAGAVSLAGFRAAQVVGAEDEAANDVAKEDAA